MGNAYLILEDGTVFCGKSIGSQREVISEVVFNTSMTGYLEVLTDPSCAGQALVMTYPLIGNYGISIEDMESSRAWPDAFIVRELSRIPSNFRSEDTIQNFLQRYDIPGVSGIDTRALTILLREKGTMNGLITTNEYSKTQIEDLLPKIRAYTTGKVVEKVTCAKKYEFTDSGDTVPQPSTVGVRNELSEEMQNRLYGRHFRVALMDFGAKRNIARSLVRRGCRVTVYPAYTSAEEILNDRPDGIMLSNGPGDPKECTQIIEQVKILYDSDVPIFAICLGHQLMALATGGDTYKMKYGHRGGNHPVKDLKTGRVYITSQNHGYVVDVEHIDPNLASPAFSNVNDGTNEGLVYLNKNIFTVQFHPEACPGPQDSGYLFDRFLMMMSSQSVS